MIKLTVNGYEDIDENFDEFIEGSKKGVIELAVPVANIGTWYGMTYSPLTVASGLTTSELERVLYFGRHLVDGKLYTEQEFMEGPAKQAAGTVTMGAAALKDYIDKTGKARVEDQFKKCFVREKELMAELERFDKTMEDAGLEYCDLSPDAELPEEEMALAEKYSALTKELKNVRDTLDACNSFRAMKDRLFITQISVLPLELRAILKRQSSRMPYAVMHDICRLYSLVASMNERVKKLTAMGAPEIILRNEQRMLQERVDTLLFNGKRGEPVEKKNGDPIKSLADIIMMDVDCIG